MVITWTELQEFSMTKGMLMNISIIELLFEEFNCCMCVIPEYVGGSECKSRALLVVVIGRGAVLGIGKGAALISHFLRKQQFLIVILSDPSTVIRYWQSGRTVMIFPVVFPR